ncbi:MAG: hypothetical protein AB8B96_17450 [Lysobacterales bacterium]
MSTIIRTDIHRMLLAWALIGLAVWQLTPWGVMLSSLIGPMWLWCGLIPGLTWVLISPAPAVRLLSTVSRILVHNMGRATRFIRSLVVAPRRHPS